MTLPFRLYLAAQQKGWKPILLESNGVQTHFGKRSILGIRPVQILKVVNGRTFLNEKVIGGLEEFWQTLETVPSENIFPCWIGFFSYEFSRLEGLPTRQPMEGLPDAWFGYFESGWVWEEGNLVEGDQVFPESPNSFPEAVSGVSIVSNFSKEDFLIGVDAVQESIREGWVYQVNLSHQFEFERDSVSPAQIYSALSDHNPSPFMGLLEGDDFAVVSGSPERLFDYRNGTVSARPIAGTRKRGGTIKEDETLEQELRSNSKENAEHVMLVDLLRNDLAKVCKPATVEVTEAFTVERYSHVMHLVSHVEGKCDKPLSEVFKSIFPGGTITGAPKESVMQSIAALEPTARGAYTGSMGYISGTGADFNILIRSFTFAGDKVYFSAGSGIVIESEREHEYAETLSKAQSMMNAIGSGSKGMSPAAPVLHAAWKPPQPKSKVEAQVLFLECHDSFSYNIVDYLRSLGAEVEVADHRENPAGWFSHIVLGPGPGDPFTSGKCLDWAKFALAQEIPILGICLGHQVLGVALGATLGRAPRAVHGESEEIFHSEDQIFAGIPIPSEFTRYHSLSLSDLPDTLEQIAWSKSEICMGIRVKNKDAWGVQFHPESLLSSYGIDLLHNFLKVRP